MIHRWLMLFAMVLLLSVLWVGGVVGGETSNDDQTRQLLERRSNETNSLQLAPKPEVKSGNKGGGDLIWWYQGIENVVCVSEFGSIGPTRSYPYAY